VLYGSRLLASIASATNLEVGLAQWTTSTRPSDGAADFRFPMAKQASRAPEQGRVLVVHCASVVGSLAAARNA